jgi:type IX secretion system PorP/SprF family membrane protein
MKKISILIATVLLVIVLTNTANAQDPIYSQFYSSPLSLNPALAGSNLKQNNRVAVNYRNLLSPNGTSMFKTTAMSYERKLIKGNNKDFFTIGGLFLSEKMGNGLLTQSFGNITTSYFNALNEDGTTGISAGLSLTYGNRMLDIFKARTQDMFGSYGFTNIGSTNDPSVSNINVNYTYVNAGVGYDARVSSKDQFHIGAAMYRVSKPKETKVGGTNLDPRYVVESRYTKQVNNNESLELVGATQWLSARNFTTVGVKYGKQLPDNDHLVEVGVLSRINDAVIPYLGFGITNGTNNLKFGLSYDIVTSKVRTIYNAQSTAELSFVWSWK